MISKYALAKEVIAGLSNGNATSEPLSGEPADVDHIDHIAALQSTVFSELVKRLVAVKGARAVEELLKYELDCLGVGGVYEIQRGSGHS